MSSGGLHAFRDGVARVNRAPWILVSVWAVTVLAALPFTVVMRGLLAGHLGDSLAAETAASGVNYDWMEEFRGQATGLAATFTTTVIGAGAVADNLSALADNQPRPPAIVAAGLLYVAAWLFLSGGIIDRFARDRALRPSRFLWASSVWFVRFMRLAALSTLAYALLFGALHPWLFDDLFASWTSNTDSEPTVFAVRMASYAAFGAAVAAVNIVFDYAKVRAVVEDRRSMLGALAGSLRFIAGNARSALGLYLVNAALLAGVIAVYALIAPGAGSIGWSMWAAFAVSQLYVLGRLWLKLLFWASETALFQSRLAHAGYAAAAPPAWPESAAAEAIGRA
jgi:hypothetical protein